MAGSPTGPMAATRSRCATLAVLLGLAVACGGNVAESPAPPTGAASEPGTTREPGAAREEAAPLLDGTEKSLVVVGYSTSFAWPTMLQEMLDEHAGGERLYHVLNAVVAGSPVRRWISAPGSEDHEETYGAMLRDFFGPEARLRGEAPEPTVAIAQQSLQWIPTRETRLGPVTSVDDVEGLRIGADALEDLAERLRADGIERVYIATHIYKDGYEPEIGNERFALEALLERGHDFVFRGPDVWSPTLREHPGAFAADGLHPGERGAKIMAELWYRTLAAADARPAIVEAMLAREYDTGAMAQRYLRWRRGDDSGS